jgi:hypothetical protein
MQRDNLRVFFSRVTAEKLPTVIIEIMCDVQNGLGALDHLPRGEPRHSCAVDRMAMNERSPSKRDPRSATALGARVTRSEKLLATISAEPQRQEPFAASSG